MGREGSVVIFSDPVFSSIILDWSKVEKAWNLLQKRLPKADQTSN